MAHEGFFDEATARSQVKARLVASYFLVWAQTMVGRLDHCRPADAPIAYVDLCAGPGRYADGTPSTPLLVLAYAVQSGAIAERLITVFNDANAAYIDELRHEVAGLTGIEALAHRPIFASQEVGAELLAVLDELPDIPALWFVDPWGFKELSLELFSSLLAGQRAELVFFFNFNRINMALGDPTRTPHLSRLFGPDGLATLRAQLSRTRPAHRESIILRQLIRSLRACGAQFVLPFRFYDLDGVRTSHYIAYATSSAVGHYLMAEVMGAASTLPDEYAFQEAAKSWRLSANIEGLPGRLLPVGVDGAVPAVLDAAR